MKFLYPIEGAGPDDIAVVGGARRDFYYKSDIYIGGQHMAIDLTFPDWTHLRPVGPATIALAGSEVYAGNFVSYDLDEGGWRVTYRHLIAPVSVVIGQRVTPQDTIGYVGQTGIYAGWSHVHVDWWNKEKRSPEAIFKNGWWAHDPEVWLGREEEDDMKLLFYRYKRTIYVIGPDGKARRISLGEWQAHAEAGAEYIQLTKADPAKIAKA